MRGEVFGDAVDQRVCLLGGSFAFEKLPDLHAKGTGEIAERSRLGEIITPLDVRKESNGDTRFFGKVSLRKLAAETEKLDILAQRFF